MIQHFVEKVVKIPFKKKKVDRPSKLSKKRSRLQTFLMRMAPKIILYTRKIAPSLKKKTSHQLLLFPSSLSPFTSDTSNYNESLIKEYNNKEKQWYQFYLSDCGIYIDNHHLRGFKQEKPLMPEFGKGQYGRVLCFGQQTLYNGRKSNKILFLGTSKGYVLTIDLESKSFTYLKLLTPLTSHSQIHSISVFENHIAVFNSSTCFICELERAPKFSLKSKYSAQISDKFIRRAQLVIENEEVYIFFINDNLHRINLREGFLSNIGESLEILAAPNFNPFTNIKIYKNDEKTIITVSCTKQLTVLSHNITETKTTTLHKFPNPTFPAEKPKFHIYSCIEYFPQSLEDGKQLLIGITFTERLYFLRVKNQHCEASKRAKFSQRILKLFHLRQNCIIIVFKGAHYDDDPHHFQLKILTTLLSQIVSFANPFNTSLIDKFEYESQIYCDLYSDKLRLTVTLFDEKELMFIGQKAIRRIHLIQWQDIYRELSKSQNLQLLYFLILLKTQKSTLLNKPKKFTGLEACLPPTTPTLKQILLQYYYLMDQAPPDNFINQIQTNQPELLIPFILHHKISNLEDDTKELLVEYWRHRDERIVEELIIGGVEHGWDIAVSKGWIRALKKMVEINLQVHAPLLKISAFIIPKLKKLENCSEAEQQQLKKQITYHCQQMIDYGMLALECFLSFPIDFDLLDEEETEEKLRKLSQFLQTLLQENIFNVLVQYQPETSAYFISKIFSSEQQILNINNLPFEVFIEFYGHFKPLVENQSKVPVSFIILSHMSETYRELTQIKTYPEQKKERYRRRLLLEHAKLILLKMKSPHLQFFFVRPYMMEMLRMLVLHNNKNLEQLIWEQKVILDEEQLQVFQQDFLVLIWKEILQGEELQKLEIKQFINVIEQINSNNYYLLIAMMQELVLSEVCSKIFRSYLLCKNKKIQNRMFSWLRDALEKEFDILDSQLILNLKNIIEINKEKSRMIFDEFYKNKERQIIKKIDSQPQLQLEYVQMIIQKLDDDEQVEEYYTNLHLKLLINEKPQKLIEVLETSQKGKKIKYDIHEAIKYSSELDYPEKNKIEMYLYEKAGDIQKSIQAYLKDLEQIIWDYIESYEAAHEQVEEKEEEYFFNQIKKKNTKISMITDILAKKEYKHRETRSLEFEEDLSNTFKELIDLIFRQSVKKYKYIQIPLTNTNLFIQHIQAQKLKHKKRYIKIISYYFGRIVVSCFEEGYLDHFIQWLKEMEGKLALDQIRQYLTEGYRNIKSQKNLFQSITQIERSVLITDIQDNLTILENCISSQAKCSLCDSNFSQKYSNRGKYVQEAVLFNCGHLFHRVCLEKQDGVGDYCWECIYNNQIKAMIDHVEINLVSILKKYCLRKSIGNVWVEKGLKKQKIISSEQKKKNKMGIFDKKMASLSNQVQIIDAKLSIKQYYEQLELKSKT